jgi:quercetin dioxygenase-like cupin family protein
MIEAADLEQRLRAEGISPTTWRNAPGDRYAAHEHGYDKVLVAARGSITFHLPADGRDIELVAGDRLDLPAGTRHAATVGAAGVSCLEAHLPAGTLDRDARHAAGWGGLAER